MPTNRYTFAHGGKYRVWLDYSLPGEPPRVDPFDIQVAGPPPPPRKLTVSCAMTQPAGPLDVETLALGKPLRAGEDIPIALKLSGRGRFPGTLPRRVGACNRDR